MSANEADALRRHLDDTDRQMILDMGPHRCIRYLHELGVLRGPVWGEDANGSLFLGWVEADAEDNHAAAVDARMADRQSP